MTREANPRLGKHAVVIGGSISGLLTARVLIRHFQRVTIIERDSLSDDTQSRKGVPQGSHVHVIFSGGMQVMDQLLPGFSEELSARGAVVCDFARDLCWYHAGVWKARPESNLRSYWQTRPFLEALLRQRIRQEAGIRIQDGTSVVGLIADDEETRITGVEVQVGANGETQSIDADLVVDASGRSSQTPRWIEALGYQRPRELTVQVNIGYASRDYEPSPEETRDWKIMALYGTPPHDTRTGYVFPIEGGRWRVSQVGFLNDTPPPDEDAYLEYAKSLERPDFYEAIKQARPLTPIASFKFPADQWRRYDWLSRFPAGLLVLGDAISTFNPVYGQGMSASALEVDELRQTLDDLPHDQGIPAHLYKTFFRRSAKVIQVPWLLATQSDFLYPETVGNRELHTGALNWYLVRMLQLCRDDEQITKTFYEVLHFIKKPTALFHPRIAARVFCVPWA